MADSKLTLLYFTLMEEKCLINTTYHYSYDYQWISITSIFSEKDDRG